MVKSLIKLLLLALFLFSTSVFAQKNENINNLNIIINVNKNGTVDVVEKTIRSYQVADAIKFLPNHDEFVWKSPTIPNTIEINIPGNIENIKCDNCSISIEGQKAFIKTNTALKSSSGFDLTVSFPKNIVNKPVPKGLISPSNSYSIIGLFILTLLWYILYPLWLPLKLYLFIHKKSLNEKEVASIKKFYNFIFLLAVVSLNIPLAFMVKIYNEKVSSKLPK